MVLFKKTVVPNECDLEMYSGQKTIQMVLVFIALICVPWMLLLKPCYIMRQKRIERYTNVSNRFPLIFCILSFRLPLYIYVTFLLDTKYNLVNLFYSLQKMMNHQKK